jgi:hypothetical protein
MATERFSDLRPVGFVEKPYQLETMIATLRDALAESKERHSAGK